jgi:hypothetical protein
VLTQGQTKNKFIMLKVGTPHRRVPLPDPVGDSRQNPSPPGLEAMAAGSHGGALGTINSAAKLAQL